MSTSTEPAADGGSAPLRVFPSHTGELADDRAADSVITAAKRALERAGHALTEMATRPAAAMPPADRVVDRLAGCGVHVEVIGVGYVSPVRGDPSRSSTLDTATGAGPRGPELLLDQALIDRSAGCNESRRPRTAPPVGRRQVASPKRTSGTGLLRTPDRA